jgi:DNA-binding SARP family transcriptional activator
MLFVKLLGRPAVLSDGIEVDGPRGNKAWALLAYLVTRGGAVPRDRLVPLLFPDAGDGLGALRWNLAQLRRVVGDPHAFSGDPVDARLGPDVRVDVLLLGTAPWHEVAQDADLGAPLLEGLTFPSCPGFELWLEGERHRVAELAAVALREAARAHTAAGRPADAARVARRLVTLRPWDESGHELLVRALARAGDPDAARAHVDLVTELFLDELGVPPSRALVAAAQPVVTPVVGATRSGTLAQLQAGVTAASAGAPDAGVESLRRAVAGARTLDDPPLLVRALTELGSAQVHSVRGTDESGVMALREAVMVAERAGRPGLATAACRELAWVEFLRCRREPAERWLDRAMATVGDDDAELAWILVIRGSLRSDEGRHAEAAEMLQTALRYAQDTGEARAAAMALTHLGRLAVLRREFSGARSLLERARRSAEAAGWLSFVPYPTSWLAELALLDGDLDEAGELFGHAHALAIEVRDPCWESISCRGLGLVAGAAGDDDAAGRLLHEAPDTCRRLPDTYLWIEAYGLAAYAAHALATGSPNALTLIQDLDRLASAHALHELQAEAALLRLAAGQPGALETARLRVAAVDNPVLADRLARLEAGLDRTYPGQGLDPAGTGPGLVGVES